ncbi:MAG: hypothetical protein AAF988_00825 [Pseudomonadota bacterium]
MIKIYVPIIALFLYLSAVNAQEACSVQDKLCLMQELERTAAEIENKSWRDKTYRELAKSYTYEGYSDKAITLIGKIETPDTRAMTIRGIGMAAADQNMPKEQYDALFSNLAKEADKIEHKPSKAIAYTYIAMSQAFAKDDEGAIATARSMENDALRHKAFAETAEIQAQRGDAKAAFFSIDEIESSSFKNKALSTVAKIFANDDNLESAYSAANKITNTYNRAQILQYILNKGNPEEDMSASN